MTSASLFTPAVVDAVAFSYRAPAPAAAAVPSSAALVAADEAVSERLDVGEVVLWFVVVWIGEVLEAAVRLEGSVRV